MTELQLHRLRLLLRLRLPLPLRPLLRLTLELVEAGCRNKLSMDFHLCNVTDTNQLLLLHAIKGFTEFTRMVCITEHRSKFHDCVPRYFCGFLLAAFLGCGDPGPASPGANTAADGGTPATFGPLGLACGTSAACPADLTCLDVSSAALGDFVAAGGFCTRACTVDSDCAALGNGACVPLVPGDASTLFCAPRCARGDSSACGNRADAACWPRELVDGTTGERVCLPTCNDNDQCPDGTVCDGQTNLCSRVATGGGTGLGSTCDPSGNNTCAEGFCLQLDASGTGVCSSYCRRGTFPQCSTDNDQGACGWVPEGDESAGPADVGLCTLRCRCDADCVVSDLHCQPHADLSGTTYPGLCTTAASPAIGSGC